MKSLENLYQYFEHFSSLRAELLETLEGWDTPTIVVFGPQNAGKSTLLERLAMLPLFPKGDGLCTRVPIRIRMRTGDEKTILKTINIESSGKELESSRSELNKTQNISEIVNQTMLNLLNQLNKKTQGIRSDRLIEVEIRRPNLPNIDLLDLPGMVINPSPKDDPDLADQTYQLVIKSLKAVKGRAIYLAVREAGDDPQQSLTVKVLRELPEIQKDCFGVLTKSDETADKKLVERLKQSQDWNLGYGYFAVVNDPNYKGLEEIAKHELKFFQETALRKQIFDLNQAGCDVLLEKLSIGYGNYLREHWAYQTFDLLKSKKEEILVHIQSLGQFFENDQVHIFEEIFKKALAEISNLVARDHLKRIVTDLQAIDLSKVFENLGFSLANKQLKISLDAFLKLIDINQDLNQNIVEKACSIISNVLASLAVQMKETLENDRFGKKAMTQLRIGRFENLVAWLATLIDQKSKQIESTLIQEIEQDWRSWWLDHCVYHGDSVIVDDWCLLINRWMNLAFFQMRDISKALVLDLDSVHHDQAKMIEFMEDFSCSERDDLNAKIHDIEVAMERMVGYFGEEIQKKRGIKKIKNNANIEGANVVTWKVGDKKKQNANGVEFEMVYCLAGEFWMEPPKHKVKMNKGFWMGETQVTQELWEKVMGWNPSGFKGSGKLPVDCVTWYDCLVFCNKLSELEKFTPCFTLSNIEKNGNQITKANVEWNRIVNGYRLPTEAEWEYCAKAGTELTYSGSNNVNDVAWYNGNSGGNTHEVKTKKANGWGLYDMSGNVWEWCMDKYDANAYQRRNNGIENPILWENSSWSHIVRGGSYGNSTAYCLVTSRCGYNADSRYNGQGFRLLRCEP